MALKGPVVSSEWRHPEVKNLPAPSGLGNVAFRDDPVDQGGEIQHQADRKWYEDGQGGPAQGAGGAAAFGPGTFKMPENVPAYTREQLKEWQYPEEDPKFSDPNWLREQRRKEDEDPRENANFFLDFKDPEFWDNVARRPYAKAILRTEEHWKGRKNMWLQQFANVREMNEYREQVVEALHDCSTETKRLVQPIMKYRIVEVFLMHTLKEAEKSGDSFKELLDKEDNRMSLCQFRDAIDLRGDAGAEELFGEWEARTMRQLADDQRKEDQRLKDAGGETLYNPEELLERLRHAEKCKKDGLLEWEKGKSKEALLSWRQGHETLWRIKAPRTNPEAGEHLKQLHSALLKNLAQAAIKQECYNEALSAAEMAIRIDDQDHKAWFRKASALERLGRVKEMEPCLEMIDSIAVGRPDRDRLNKDTSNKRETIRKILEREEDSQRLMLQRGVQKALFSDSRDTSAKVIKGPPAPPPISHKVQVPGIDDAKRKKLTKDGAEDILKDLAEAYGDPTFRKQVSKLGRDVTDQAEFICYLNRVALPYQKAILEKWGFEASEKGVKEMTRAIQDHTRTEDGNSQLRVQAEETMRILYGEFYDVARAAGIRPDQRARKPEQRRRKKDDGSSSSEEEAPEQASYHHWTGRPTGEHEWHWERERQQREQAEKERAAKEAEEAELSKITAKDSRDIWKELSKAMSGKDPDVLRMAIKRAVRAKLSSVTVRSAKDKLLLLGGRTDDL